MPLREQLRGWSGGSLLVDNRSTFRLDADGMPDPLEVFTFNGDERRRKI